jgi:hypothetical protein
MNLLKLFFELMNKTNNKYINRNYKEVNNYYINKIKRFLYKQI